jgi:hypothetical protein
MLAAQDLKGMSSDSTSRGGFLTALDPAPFTVVACFRAARDADHLIVRQTRTAVRFILRNRVPGCGGVEENKSETGATESRLRFLRQPPQPHHQLVRIVLGLANPLCCLIQQFYAGHLRSYIQRLTFAPYSSKPKIRFAHPS